MSSLDADQMDFWDSLVEQPSSEGWIEQDLGIKGKRKSSFVSIGEDSFSDYFRPNTLKRVKV